MNSHEILRRTTRNFWQKWSLTFKIMPVLLIVALLKFASHHYNLEVMELNALFTSMVAGTIFLIGFLITGVLSDYKESEKIPSELSASLRTLFDDTYTIYKTKNSQTAAQFIAFQKMFTASLMDWFFKKEKTRVMMSQIAKMNDFFVELDKEGIQPAYILRMKNEQHNIRKMMLRIDTIRDTDFVKSAYAILEAMGFIIAIGMIIINIKPFYASLFFTLAVTFLIFYMFFLIRDLDNPFDYSEKGEGGTEVPLKPLHDHQASLEEVVL